MDIIAYARRQTLRESSMVHLISYGDVPAIPADEVQVGMHIRYNYGSHAPVVATEQLTPATIAITVEEHGATYTRRCRCTTLVPAYWPKE